MTPPPPSPPPYAELDVTTNFTFLHGASHPDELVVTAAALGLHALAVTDRNTLAGVVRAWTAARAAGLRLIVGCRLDLEDAPSVLVYPTDRAAYGRLCTLLTLGRRRAPKGACFLSRDDLAEHAAGLIAAVLPPEEGLTDGRGMDAFERELAALRDLFPGDTCHLAARCRLDGRDARRLATLAAVAARVGVPLLATNGVRLHTPARRPLLDVLTCIREHVTVDAAGWRLAANAEAHLKSPAAMAALFADYPDALTRTVAIADRCTFDLADLRYEYPDDITPPDRTPQQHLEDLTQAGLAWRWPEGAPASVRATVARELAIIDQLGYAPYFLTVYDIVRFARSQDILCQGRGSAANSAVCYCLGITAIDPARFDLLFERFVSAARDEPPDIDVDFEHERREEVIQYIYDTYGRTRAGLAATVIAYRSRSALRDVGKALGLSQDAVSALSGTVWGISSRPLEDAQVREAGLDPDDARLRLALDLVDQLRGFPRHLSQHVGGFVITRGALHTLVPIENAAMENRTVIQWDKDDLDALGLLKVDILALGMLSCVRKAFDLLRATGGPNLTLASVPADDPRVYDMLCDADALGVFQVESRAQMSMLPRLRPRAFYDLVVEVAIVRPGPIQGNMVHPYLRRRQGLEPVSYPSDALRRVLEKTLGVPLFQEQAMRIAIDGAGFTPTEADQLRRAMATFRRAGTIHGFRERFVAGMLRSGHERAFAENCFRQIEGFGEYGFPESHAASFALLAYVSAWLKRHHPAVFACALLNSQPMGFYSAAQIVRDARDHGVTVRPVDVTRSAWDNTLETARGPDGAPSDARNLALRLGLRQIKGLSGSVARGACDRLIGARTERRFRDVEDLWRRAGLTGPVLDTLARADALAGLGLDRRAALWAVKRLTAPPLPLFARPGASELGPEPEVTLPDLREDESVVEDYRSLRLTLRTHPLALLRAELDRDGVLSTERLRRARDGERVRTAGLVVCRQRPGTAKGVLFITLEDDLGVANLIVPAQVFEANRRAVLQARLLEVEGRFQSDGTVQHVMVGHLLDRSDRLAALTGAPSSALALDPSRADRVGRFPPAMGATVGTGSA
ncbi:error-prone DNA polymerase [Roseospira marina]|uniref:Error-prone DNA polymerase n=1 Tax=Roseospira marina TaxID=140057 RepID=A0A5M6I9Q1_9PROT|nr:error-prone DNA polymerase [Roseospira marina]KAA5604923.1 error-prone DNA polymerase [Roseospira marina]MBB4315267.1 error-prone DNA polymerase [Roseospira marina]MBB5088267.1 error-prone DNA polymerase [Roseospira marina]